MSLDTGSEQQPVDDDGRVQRLLNWRLATARLAIGWEQLWLAIAPPAGVVALFTAFSLGGLWYLVPGWLHIVLLLVFTAALISTVWYAVRTMRWPTRGNAERRLETSNPQSHRPVRTLYDRQISGVDDPGSRSLWRLHRLRMLEQVKRLRSGWPHPMLARRDPRALRAIVGLLLTIGIVIGGSDAGPRLLAALSPSFTDGSEPTATTEAWITPPEYTGVPPIFLTAATSPEAERPVLEVPTGSTFLAQISGAGMVPHVTVDDRRTPFTAIDEQSFRAEVTLDTGTKLAVMRGEKKLAGWWLSIIPDRVPTVAFASAPKPTQALELAYEARDDYGLSSVRALITREGSSETITLELPLAGSGLTKASEKSFHDLTPHAWAGLEVKIKLAAADAIDQVGYSEILEIVLPERKFTHPVARALIEQRKILAQQPQKRDKVATALRALSLIPEKYDNDLVVHLSLRTAQSRLRRDGTKQTLKEVRDLLWDTALRLDDGNLSLAQARLREAQQALMDALARNAPDEEIERLMDELKRAMERYLQALAEQALKRAERGELGLDTNALNIQEFDLEQMLERARELSQMGARDAARQLLSQLQSMLENLRAGLTMNPLEQSTQQALRGLNQLMREQQQLLDQTFRSEQRGQPAPGRSFPGMGQDQEALRRMLGDIMRRLGETRMQIPQSMGRAERSMRDAREALNQGQPGQAVGPQSEALDLLREGADALFRSLMAGGDLLDGDVDMEGTGRFDRDPFGRFVGPGGAIDDERVKIPEKSDIQRARDILDELYRRSGQRSRSSSERNYIDRLLRRF